MPFTVPNRPDASHTDQAEPDSVDFQIATDHRFGVFTGGDASPQGGNMVVSITTPLVVLRNGQAPTVGTGTSLNVTIGPASSGPRFDLIVVNSANALAVVSGTTLAGTNPRFPVWDRTCTILHAVYVPAGTTALTPDLIIDKRRMVSDISMRGSGLPEGNVTAPPGSMWANIDGDAGQFTTSSWVKDSGTGNTGWFQVITDGTAQQRLIPAGTISATIANAPDVGWLFLQGQTVINASTLYPDFWSKIPSGWKSGNNALLPDARQRGLGGYQSGIPEFTTLGGLGGANNHTNTLAEMPAHNHGGTTGSENTDHSHGVSIWSDWVSSDHTHGFNVNTNTVGSHAHPAEQAGLSYMVEMSSYTGDLNTVPWPSTPNSGLQYGWRGGTGSAGDHAHNVAGSTGGISANHQHAVNGNTSGRSVGHTHTLSTNGSTAPFSVVSAILIVNWQIKVH